MVEIRYGDHYDVADLGGRTVAQARERYESEFGIPDRSRARVNGKGIARRREARTELGADDKVTFVEKSRKGLFLIGAVLLALMISGGIFAYTATTDTLDLGLTEKGEFASVTKCTGPTWNVWGHYKGKMTAGDLFKIEPEADYTGDLSVMVTLVNGHELVKCYRVMVFKISVYEDNGSGTGADTSESLGGPDYVTLTKGEVIIDLTSLPAGPFWVHLDTGFYVTHHSWSSGDEDPTLLCNVAQKGVM